LSVSKAGFLPTTLRVPRGRDVVARIAVTLAPAPTVRVRVVYADAKRPAIEIAARRANGEAAGEARLVAPDVYELVDVPSTRFDVEVARAGGAGNGAAPGAPRLVLARGEDGV